MGRNARGEAKDIESFLGDGWYPIEASEQKRWAWSQQQAWLRFPEHHEGFSLDFSSCPVRDSFVVVMYQNKPVYRETWRPGSLAVINIPPGIQTAAITVAQAWVPKELLGAGDARALGVCLQHVRPLQLYAEYCLWRPRVIEIGLVGVCNIDLPCVMCVTRNANKKGIPPHIPKDILQKVIPYLNDAQVVSLHGGEGEPLLSPDLLPILRTIEPQVYTLFATNGLLLTKEMSMQLISLGLKEITFSIDAATRQTYHKIRNNDGFLTVVKGIKQLAALKKSLHKSLPNILINMALMKENIAELPAFIALAHELGASTAHVRLLVPVTRNYEIVTDQFRFNYCEQRIDPLAEDFRRIIFEAKRQADEYGIMFVSDNPEIAALFRTDSKITESEAAAQEITLHLSGENAVVNSSAVIQHMQCLHPWQNVLIGLDGSVRFCCHSHQVLGNLNNDTFLDVWNGDPARGIRGAFLKNQFPDTCLACPLHLPQGQAWKILKQGIKGNDSVFP